MSVLSGGDGAHGASGTGLGSLLIDHRAVVAWPGGPDGSALRRSPAPDSTNRSRPGPHHHRSLLAGGSSGRARLALAGTGQHEQARELAQDADALARTITNPDLQASALIAIAHAHHQIGLPGVALRTLAVALTVPTPNVGWLVATVAAIEPESVGNAWGVISDCVRRSWSAAGSQR